MCTKSYMNTIHIFIFLIVLFISINTTNGFNNISTITSQNHSLSNRTTTIYPWKKSNSIEILKKLIANRQIITKHNRTLLLSNTTQRILSTLFLIRVKPTISTLDINSTTTDILYFSTTQSNFLLFSSLSQTINTKQSSNATTLAITFICCFIGFLSLTLILTFVLRQHINHSYFKLPCIHSLSTTKQSCNSTPLSYSPIHGKHQEGLVCVGTGLVRRRVIVFI